MGKTSGAVKATAAREEARKEARAKFWELSRQINEEHKNMVKLIMAPDSENRNQAAKEQKEKMDRLLRELEQIQY